MKFLTATRHARALRCATALLALVPGVAALAATSINFATYPLFLAPPIKPNVLIMFDNSESMDATMSGMVISGDDVTTRGNIARTVLRGVLDTYKDAFNWGLGSFETTGGAGLYTTYPYWLGTASTMKFTNDCVSGISASNSGLRCIANPQPANGFNFVTYEKSGDDADVNDVFYTSDLGAYFFAVGSSGNSYTLYRSHNNTTGWSAGDFTSSLGGVTFTPTDAGYLPNADNTPRGIFIKRGWGYGNNISGKGKVNENVAAYSTTHFSALNTLLANETNTGSGEIKNNAFFTPLTGTLATASDYFSKGLSGSQKSPITQSCQRNYVLLATDGNPTGKTDGSQYNPSQWINTQNTTSGVWTYGQAQLDVFTQITALRSTTLSGSNLSDTTLAGKRYDIQTYVVGMGDTLSNPSSIAALNRMADLGGGYPTAFLGSNSTALQTAFQSIVGDIQTKTSAASSVALNSGSWTTSAAVYQAKFNSSDWSGNIAAFAVASDGTLATSPSWEAAVRLRAQNYDTGRAILTYKPSGTAGSRGIRFRWPANAASPTATELDASQVTALNKNASGTADANGTTRLTYLRGDTSKEIRICSACTQQYRSRPTTPLGDIVNSAPYYVGGPAFGYYDDFESAPYSSFAATYRTRTPVIYAGANDGMLHGFNATTGDEMIAYVPSMVYDNLPKLTASNYSHQYYVDGSPTVGDVFYASNWHSMLVSGLRSGGKGIFALDVTDPTTFSEGNAASIVRWEYTDSDMGYVFGQPLLVKANTGKWVAIIGGGYGHGSTTGRAKLFIIDVETGALVSKIDTANGTAASPNGLSAPAAIDTNGDGIADLVYAGDLNGNMWKFDISAASAASWGMGNGGLPLFTTQSNQPIIDRPDVTKHPRGGYVVSFGTGRYMDVIDISLPVSSGTDPNPNNYTQSVYGIWDNLTSATVTLSGLQQQSVVAVATGTDGNDYRLTTHAVDPPTDATVTGDNVITLASYYSTKRGWYANLPSGGERVVADPRFRGGRVVFTSVIPDTTSACAFGGTGWVMEFDAINGNRLDTVTFDTNNSNTLTTDDYVVFSGASASALNTSGRKINAIPAAPGFMGNKESKGTLEDKYINTSEGTIVRVRETAGKGGEGRIMWREIE